jgi:hypothetical protein
MGSSAPESVSMGAQLILPKKNGRISAPLKSFGASRYHTNGINAKTRRIFGNYGAEKSRTASQSALDME